MLWKHSWTTNQHPRRWLCRQNRINGHIQSEVTLTNGGVQQPTCSCQKYFVSTWTVLFCKKKMHQDITYTKNAELFSLNYTTWHLFICLRHSNVWRFMLSDKVHHFCPHALIFSCLLSSLLWEYRLLLQLLWSPKSPQSPQGTADTPCKKWARSAHRNMGTHKQARTHSLSLQGLKLLILIYIHFPFFVQSNQISKPDPALNLNL